MSLWLLILCFLFNLKSFSLVTEFPIHRYNRVRRLAFDIEPSIAFDMELVLPFPMFKGVEIAAVVDVPFVIHISDESHSSTQSESTKGSYMEASDLESTSGGSGGGSGAEESNLIAKQPSNLQYPTFVSSYYDEAIMNSTEQPRIADTRRYYYDHYRRTKRQLRSVSARHRHDIFESFSKSLSR